MFRKKLEDNIWKYGIQLATNKRIFIAVLGVYYLTIPDVTIQSVGVIGSIGFLFGFIMEIPSGYIADKIGHKQALIFSNLMLLLSSTAFYFSNSYYLLAIASILLSAGNAFSSGTGTAFMHETISALGKEKDYIRIMGRLRSLGFAIPAIITALIPFLVIYGYKTPFLIAIIIDVIGLTCAISLVSPKGKYEKIENSELGPNNFMRAFREIKHHDLMPGMLFSAVVSAFVFTFGQFRGPYQELVGIAVIWFGILHSSGRLIASAMLWFSGKLHTKISQDKLRLLKIFLFGSLALVLAFVKNMYVVGAALLLMNAFVYGLNGLSGGETHKKLKNSSLKATILSIRAQVQNIATALFVLLFGFLVLNYGYKDTFLSFGLSFVALALMIHSYIKNRSDGDGDDSGGE